MIELLQHRTIFNDIKAMIKAAKTGDDAYTRLSEVQEQLARLEDLYITEGSISKSSYLARRGELLNELKRLQGQLGDSVGPIMDEMLMSLDAVRYAQPATKKR